MPRTTIHPDQHLRASVRRRGFSLMEVAAAMGVFALGFVAIAAIFPIAAMIQKQTARQFLGAEAANNVVAMMEMRKFTTDFLENGVTGSAFTGIPDDSMDVFTILRNLDPPGVLRDLSPPNRIFEHWMLADRSFPSGPPFLVEPIPSIPETEELYLQSLRSRDVYAVPLVRRAKLPTSPSDWQVFVFILKRDSGTYTRAPFSAFSGWANYDGYDVSDPSNPVWRVPGVRGVSVGMPATNRFTFSNTWGSGLEIDRGDLVLDSNGNIHTVESADNGGIYVVGDIPVPMEWNGSDLVANPPSALWYGRRSGPEMDSPTIQILVLDDAVE